MFTSKRGFELLLLMYNRGFVKSKMREKFSVFKLNKILKYTS